MTTPDELLAELAQLAASIGPAVRPVGSEELLRSLTETARQLFGAAACSLALLSNDESELMYTTAVGAGADDITGMRIPAGQGIAGWVVQSGQPIAISDLRNDARFSRDVAEQTGYVPDAIIAVPVASAQRTLGVISLLDRDSQRPGAEDDLRLLSLFADQAAIALESVQSFAELGSVLLAALAEAAGTDGDLAAAAQRAAEQAGPADQDLAALAATFVALLRQGRAERQLAVSVLTAIGEYAGRRPSRTR
jgi:GAF domain-containing protein